MKKLFCLHLFFLFIATTAAAQHVEENYPDTLWCPNDTFYIKYKDYPRRDPVRVSRTDKGSPGTDAAINEYITIYYGKDSVRINYHNKIPYAHIIYIPFKSPKGQTTLRFHYNVVYCAFPLAYAEKNEGQIQFDIPEAYELANIIWTLSPTGQRAKDLYTKGAYYERMMKWFTPYAAHPLFKKLDFHDSLYFDRYLDFRENSFAFNYDRNKNKLLLNGPYYYVWGDELADSSLFGKLIPLIEDFALKSKFRQFYQNNRDYYTKHINRQKQLLPVKAMWTWLEEQFPKMKYNSYRVVFSPLIGGTHSTQRYTDIIRPNRRWFRENVMFICGTDRYEVDSLTEKQREGLMSGIVFTEIDHNYVNPASSNYGKQIDSIFSNRATWVRQEFGNSNYGAPISVFNEYMTHAAFCLYVLDSYDQSTAEFVIKNREELMVNRRGFIRFKEFNQELIRLKKANQTTKLVDLYPAIIQWCGTQQ